MVLCGRRIDVCDAVLLSLIIEEKKHKLTELKTGLDEADSLVLAI